MTLVVVLPLFAGLFWWQVQRVRQGNTLSWAYVFEWPFFACYAVYLWWRLVHEQPEPAGSVAPAAPATAAATATATATAAATAAAATPAPEPAARAAAPPSAAGSAAGSAAATPATSAPPTPVRDTDADTDAEGADQDDDEELAAYNRYLTELDASGPAKRW